jgi:hypothetical protein
MKNIRLLILMFALFCPYQKVLSQTAFYFWPRDYSVFQRSGSGYANVSISGGIYYKPTSTWEYKVDKLTIYGSYSSTQVNWTTVTKSSPGDVFNFNINLPTGWYRVQMRVHEVGSNYTYADGPLFGVGEVITIAGQSNAQGHPDIHTGTYPTDYPGNSLNCIVSSVQTDGNLCRSGFPLFPSFTYIRNSQTWSIAPNGFSPWAYLKLGESIASSTTGTATPTLFVNAGASGTSISNWSNTANSDTATSPNVWTPSYKWCEAEPNSGEGEPYRTFRSNLHFYGSIFGTRGVLWHQGESDSYVNTTYSDYKNQLENVINKSRSHFNANLAWAVSNVSRDGLTSTSTDVINAQNAVKSSLSNVVNGSVNSDNINLSGDRTSDDVHFAKQGLGKLADDYWDEIDDTGGLLDKTPISGSTLKAVSHSKSGSTHTFTAPSGYYCYQWRYYDAYTIPYEGWADFYSNVPYPPNPSTCTSNNTLVTSSEGTWFCYMMDYNGNVHLSQVVRVKSSDLMMMSEPGSIYANVFPNPVSFGEGSTLEASFDEIKNLKVELVSSDGLSVKELYNGESPKGRFTLPLTISKKDCVNSTDNSCINYVKVTYGSDSVVKRMLAVD